MHIVYETLDMLAMLSAGALPYPHMGPVFKCSSDSM